MRSFIPLAFFGGLLLLSSNAIAFDGPPPPRDIPFTHNGQTYNSYVQAWHPYYAQSQICYYPRNFDQTLAPVLTTDGVIQFGYLGQTRLLLNPASFNQSWDSVAFNATGVLCALYWSGEWNTAVAQPTSIVNAQYFWADWYFLSHDDLMLASDLVRAVGIDVRANFTYDYAGQFGLGAISTGDVVVSGSSPPALVIQPLASDADGLMAEHVIGQCLFGGFCARDRDSEAHSGIDLKVSPETVVYSICDGKVLYARTARSYPNIWNRFTVVEHTNCAGYAKLVAYYGHINADVQESTPRREVRVLAGQPLGKVAAWPGNIENSHLHFGLSGSLQRAWGYAQLKVKTTSDCLETSVTRRTQYLLQNTWLDPAIFGATNKWKPFKLSGGSAQGSCNAPDQIYLPPPAGNSVPYFPWSN